MWDPYKILGIRRNASQETIEKAFRKKSMESHPDRNNGDSSLFRDVAKAYEVLKDKAKRRRYDSTGEFDEALVMYEINGMTNALEEAYTAVMSELLKANEVPAQHDLVLKMIVYLSSRIEELTKIIEEMIVGHERIKDTEPRFISENGDLTINQIVAVQVQKFERSLRKQKQIWEDCKMAVKYLNGWKFDRDKVEERMITVGTNGFFKWTNP